MITLADIYQSLKADLESIEEGLEKAIDRDVPSLYDASTHLLKAGGKRIRPVFVLLSGKFGRYDLDHLSKLAIALELIHMATLVHDDVIDDATTRRGRKTVKAQWDNQMAMFTGDYILAKALLVATEIENPKVHQILSSAIVEMTKGEIEQIKDFFRHNVTFRQYLRRIKRKTALLIAISCQLGAMVSGASPAISNRLYRFGYFVGMAFQITDDILDFTATEKELGKPSGSDLRQGNITLPAIYAIRHSLQRDKLKSWIEDRRVDEHMSEIMEIVASSGGIQFSQELAARYLHKAKKELSVLPNIKANELLGKISDFIGKRNY